MKVLARDSLKALENTEVEWELDHNSQELREKFHLLRLYLDYLRRFVKGVVYSYIFFNFECLKIRQKGGDYG